MVVDVLFHDLVLDDFLLLLLLLLFRLGVRTAYFVLVVVLTIIFEGWGKIVDIPNS